MSDQELIEAIPTSITPIMMEETPVTEDFDKVRQNLSDIIDTATTAAEELAGIAQQSQNAKVYESLSTMLNTALAANKELLGIHKTAKEVRGKTSLGERNNAPGTVHNNLFVGSTAELLEFMKENNLNGTR